MHKHALLLAVLVVLLSAAPAVHATTYDVNEEVRFYVNKVGPFANPSESYEYYSFKFCRPDKIKGKNEDLGELLGGDRLKTAPYVLPFRKDLDTVPMCDVVLEPKDIRKFQRAIDLDYYWEMYVDGLPLFGLLGERVLVENAEGAGLFSKAYAYYLYRHLDFRVLYNDNHVIQVKVEVDDSKRVDISSLEGDITVHFSYTVAWEETTHSHRNRMQLYETDPQFEIHWMSIITSFMLVVLLTGFMACVLLRSMHGEAQQYRLEDDEEEEETGWKLVHGDVFRFPRHKSLFCAFIGTGVQLFACVTLILVPAAFGMYKPYSRSTMVTTMLVFFALTAWISGFVSGMLYKKMQGDRWAWNLLLTASVFVLPFFLVGVFINAVAYSYGATQALPFSTILGVIALLLFIHFPLTVVGGIAGRNLSGPFHFPVRTKPIPREIPPVPWYRAAVAQVLLGGLLPYSVFYVELHYVFQSVWGHAIYTLYGVLLTAFCLLVLVTAFITTSMTFLQIAAEDYRWWWRSVATGGSTGLFVYAFSLFYYTQRSDMYGLLQTSVFFGVMLLVSFAFALMLGSVGWFSSLLFTKYMYRSIKVD